MDNKTQRELIGALDTIIDVATKLRTEDNSGDVDEIVECAQFISAKLNLPG